MFATQIRLFAAAAMAATVMVLGACETTEEAVLPSRITLESGDGQYSKFGTVLPEPLAIKVKYHDLSEAEGATVRFAVVEGGGVLSRARAVTDGRGFASVRYTLGGAVGTNRIRATLDIDNSKFVEFTATAAEYFCPEEDPTFSEKYGSAPGLLLFTRNSSVNKRDGSTVAGVVKVEIAGNSLRTSSFTAYEEGTGWIAVRDCAFSPAGDFYLSRQDVFDEVVKIRPNKRTNHFATLESGFGGEITTCATGVLVGCDPYGPFVVGCRDTLQRFEHALYSGAPGDAANGEAVAVDTNPLSQWFEDIYFIYLADNTLRRLPVDTLVATGPTEIVYRLSRDEANGARGMECNDNGDIYILVDDDDDDKAILKITPSGVYTREFDFYSRGSTAEEAGSQRDLAILKGGNPILYTIDTENNLLLWYDSLNGLFELFPDTTSGYDPEAISTDAATGERVGLVVIPLD